MTEDKIAANAVTGGKIENSAVTTAHILNGTIIAEDIGFNYAGSTSPGGPAIDLVSSGAVDTTDIADNAVTTAKIQPDVVSSVEGVSNDGGNIDLIPGLNITITGKDTANTITIGASGIWKLAGNTGTTPGTHFLGTIDDQPLKLRVFGARALRLEPHAASPNFIAGCSCNSVTSGVYGATIGGGGTEYVINQITDNYGTIGGGRNNRAGDNAGTTEDATYATVGGGCDNLATADHATVGGGCSNLATANSAAVSGGIWNDATSSFATVGGGQMNGATADYATVGGGLANTASASYATVGGGSKNRATADYATIAGGGPSDPGLLSTRNRVTDDYGTIGGGGNNQAGNNTGTTEDATYATICGGEGNKAMRYHTAVGGGQNNFAYGDYAVIAGGLDNSTPDSYCNVGGGRENVSGNDDSILENLYITIGGGYQNSAIGLRATIGGGYMNQSNSNSCVVAGGRENQATGGYSAVGGGRENVASGYYSAIPGGYGSTASASFSFAAGSNAMAEHSGAFVWGDASTQDAVASTDENQFLIRASGGTWLYSDPDLTSGVRLSAGSSALATVSDRNMKDNIRQVEVRNILSRLSQIPISRWNYKTQDSSIEHIGPMAQDFYAAFGLDDDDRHISTIDADGVALAAIQGLYELVKEKDAEIAVQQEQIAKLAGRLAALEAVVLSEKD